MKVGILAILCSTVLALNLRSAQSVDKLQPAELSVQLFGQVFDIVVQGLELQLLTMLYPDNAADVQAQLDVCEANYWQTEVSDLQTLGADLSGFLSACSAADSFAPVNTFLQDTLSLLLATAVPQCPDLSVDFAGDLNRFVGASLQQAFEVAGPVVGPLVQTTAAAVRPFEVSYDDLLPLDAAIRSVLRILGATEEEMDASSVYARPQQDGINTIINDIASTGAPAAADVEAELINMEGLWNANAVGYTEGFRRLVPSIKPEVQSLCSFVGVLSPSL